jgi:hypothetical protein
MTIAGAGGAAAGGGGAAGAAGSPRSSASTAAQEIRKSPRCIWSSMPCIASTALCSLVKNVESAWRRPWSTAAIRVSSS